MVTGELDEEQRTLSIRVRGDILSTNAEACLSSASDILRKGKGQGMGEAEPGSQLRANGRLSRAQCDHGSR